DLLRFSRMAAGVTLRLSAAGPQKITRGPSGVKLSLNGTFENVIGSAFHDRISGNDAANVIHGGGGKDALWGVCGDDILDGHGGNDALFGGRGNDILFGGSGDDILVGGPGRNLLFGQGGRNIIVNGAGNDRFRAGIADRFVFGTRIAYDAGLYALLTILARE